MWAEAERFFWIHANMCVRKRPNCSTRFRFIFGSRRQVLQTERPTPQVGQCSPYQIMCLPYSAYKQTLYGPLQLVCLCLVAVLRGCSMV